MRRTTDHFERDRRASVTPPDDRTAPPIDTDHDGTDDDPEFDDAA
jgi:hypothetical protein